MMSFPTCISAPLEHKEPKLKLVIVFKDPIQLGVSLKIELTKIGPRIEQVIDVFRILSYNPHWVSIPLHESHPAKDKDLIQISVCTMDTMRGPQMVECAFKRILVEEDMIGEIIQANPSFRKILDEHLSQRLSEDCCIDRYISSDTSLDIVFDALNRKDYIFPTIMHFCVYYKLEESVWVLFEDGNGLEYCNQRNDAGDTPLDVAITRGFKISSGKTKMHFQNVVNVWEGFHSIKNLLKKHGPNSAGQEKIRSNSFENIATTNLSPDDIQVPLAQRDSYDKNSSDSETTEELLRLSKSLELLRGCADEMIQVQCEQLSSKENLVTEKRHKKSTRLSRYIECPSLWRRAFNFIPTIKQKLWLPDPATVLTSSSTGDPCYKLDIPGGVPSLSSANIGIPSTNPAHNQAGHMTLYSNVVDRHTASTFPRVGNYRKSKLMQNVENTTTTLTLRVGHLEPQSIALSPHFITPTNPDPLPNSKNSGLNPQERPSKTRSHSLADVGPPPPLPPRLRKGSEPDIERGIKRLTSKYDDPVIQMVKKEGSTKNNLGRFIPLTIIPDSTATLRHGLTTLSQHQCIMREIILQVQLYIIESWRTQHDRLTKHDELKFKKEKIGYHQEIWSFEAIRPAKYDEDNLFSDERGYLDSVKIDLVSPPTLIENFETSPSPARRGTYLLPKMNTHFVGRVGEMELLHNSLLNQRKDKSRNEVTVLSGLGGVGKTALSIHYAWAYSEQFYKNVLYVNCETRYSFTKCISALAEKLQISSDPDNIGSLLNYIHKNLGKSNFLLIFDNVENYDMIKPYLPTDLANNSRPFLLLTSRSQAWTDKTHLIVLNVLTPNEAFQLLSTYVDIQSDEECVFVEKLNRALGNLPLALKQVGQFLISNLRSCSEKSLVLALQECIHTLDENPKRLLNFQLTGDESGARTTWATWKNTLESIRKIGGSLALTILEISSVLGAENIPFQLFCRNATESQSFAELSEIPFRVFQILKDHSIISVDENLKTFNIHILVQAVIRARIEQLNSMLQVVVRMLEIPLNQNTLDEYTKLCSTHSQVLSTHIVRNGIGNQFDGFLNLTFSKCKLVQAEHIKYLKFLMRIGEYKIAFTGFYIQNRNYLACAFKGNVLAQFFTVAFIELVLAELDSGETNEQSILLYKGITSLLHGFLDHELCPIELNLLSNFVGKVLAKSSRKIADSVLLEVVHSIHILSTNFILNSADNLFNLSNYQDMILRLLDAKKVTEILEYFEIFTNSLILNPSDVNIAHWLIQLTVFLLQLIIKPKYLKLKSKIRPGLAVQYNKLCECLHKQQSTDTKVFFCLSVILYCSDETSIAKSEVLHFIGLRTEINSKMLNSSATELSGLDKITKLLASEFEDSNLMGLSAEFRKRGFLNYCLIYKWCEQNHIYSELFLSSAIGIFEFLVKRNEIKEFYEVMRNFRNLLENFALSEPTHAIDTNSFNVILSNLITLSNYPNCETMKTKIRDETFNMFKLLCEHGKNLALASNVSSEHGCALGVTSSIVVNYSRSLARLNFAKDILDLADDFAIWYRNFTISLDSPREIHNFTILSVPEILFKIACHPNFESVRTVLLTRVHEIYNLITKSVDPILRNYALAGEINTLTLLGRVSEVLAVVENNFTEKRFNKFTPLSCMGFQVAESLLVSAKNLKDRITENLNQLLVEAYRIFILIFEEGQRYNDFHSIYDGISGIVKVCAEMGDDTTFLVPYQKFKNLLENFLSFDNGNLVLNLADIIFEEANSSEPGSNWFHKSLDVYSSVNEWVYAQESPEFSLISRSSAGIINCLRKLKQNQSSTITQVSNLVKDFEVILAKTLKFDEINDADYSVLYSVHYAVVEFVKICGLDANTKNFLIEKVILLYGLIYAFQISSYFFGNITWTFEQIAKCFLILEPKRPEQILNLAKEIEVAIVENCDQTENVTLECIGKISQTLLETGVRKTDGRYVVEHKELVMESQKIGRKYYMISLGSRGPESYHTLRFQVANVASEILLENNVDSLLENAKLCFQIVQRYYHCPKYLQILFLFAEKLQVAGFTQEALQYFEFIYKHQTDCLQSDFLDHYDLDFMDTLLALSNAGNIMAESLNTIDFLHNPELPGLKVWPDLPECEMKRYEICKLQTSRDNTDASATLNFRLMAPESNRTFDKLFDFHDRQKKFDRYFYTYSDKNCNL